MQKLPAFSDVQEVMERAALNPRGLRYRLKSWGQTINFRQRCYRFRKAQQKLAREELGFVPGVASTTRYDDLELFILNSRGEPQITRPTVHYEYFDIVIRHREPQGEIIEEDYDQEEPPIPSSLNLNL